jgi:hypothetical protein
MQWAELCKLSRERNNMTPKAPPFLHDGLQNALCLGARESGAER